MLRVLIDTVDFDTTMRLYVIDKRDGKTFVAKPATL